MLNTRLGVLHSFARLRGPVRVRAVVRACSRGQAHMWLQVPLPPLPTATDLDGPLSESLSESPSESLSESWQRAEGAPCPLSPFFSFSSFSFNEFLLWQARRRPPSHVRVTSESCPSQV